MTASNSQSAVLVLADGTFLEGKAFGYRGLVTGEVVFNTGITGYQEVLTDPSYFGQLVTFTYPELGNTGVNPNDKESDNTSVKGVIVRQFSKVPSNWRSRQSFENWLKDEKVIGIYGVDTRALVRHLRELGTMNGLICSDGSSNPNQLLEILKQTPSMEGLNLANKVTVKDSYIWNSACLVDFDIREKNKPSKPYKVIAVDFGIKRAILNRLTSYGCEVEVVPANTDFSSIMRLNPEGVFLSNGPGDPSSVKEGIALAKALIHETNIPIFGICLGHQILGLALGGTTYKLPYGHRGLNHPCGTTGHLEITSQNHGFALDPKSLPKGDVLVTHLNLNDRTVAGISVRDRPIFGIQYHPEASPGPHDADHHFERFVSHIEKHRLKVV